jgi:hypothetical protein
LKKRILFLGTSVRVSKTIKISKVIFSKKEKIKMEEYTFSSSEDLETITTKIIEGSFQMRKDLDYSHNKKIEIVDRNDFKSENLEIEIDEEHTKICNTYSNSTIMNAKNFQIEEETRGCLTSTYTQDLRLCHEDRFLFQQTTLTNLKAIRYQNPDHKYTSNIIVPPEKTVQDGMTRLIENTLAQHSDAFIITVFGGSYLTKEEEFETVGDKFMPYDENVDRGDPCDLGYVLGNIQSFSHQILVFNHYGCREQYSYFLNNPLKRTCFFDEAGCTLEEFDLDQYKVMCKIEDTTQYAYSSLILLRAIREFLRKGYRKLIFHVKYDYENLFICADYKRFEMYFARKNVTVKYAPFSIYVSKN